MTYKHGYGNQIDDTAEIGNNVVLGNYNYIGPNVVIKSNGGLISIGDCNYFHEGTRVLMDKDSMDVGDWNVLHNNMLVMGHSHMEIGHNCWFGQNTILDSSGGLFIGNGVRVGMYSQIWTHVASGELIEGCTLFSETPTYIEDEVWLVGSCTVGSGIRLGRRSICMIGSLLTKDTTPGCVYGGAPAKPLDKLNFWRKISLDEKYEMMLGWCNDYAEESDYSIEVKELPEAGQIHLKMEDCQDVVVIGKAAPALPLPKDTSYFNLREKTYTKQLTLLERNLYKYLFGNKARFIPVSKISN
jgi:acetyltransferase-like isoleucine patch superfamily enzyme